MLLTCILLTSLVLSLSACTTTSDPKTIPIRADKKAASLTQSPLTTTDSGEITEKKQDKPTATTKQQLHQNDKSLYQAAMTALENQNAKKALIILEEIQISQPWFVGAWINGAKAHMELGQWSEALQALQQTQVLDPEISATYTMKAYCYRHLGKFNDAQNAYKKALSLQPDYALAHYNYGILLDLYLQQPKQALLHYQHFQRLQKTPDQQVQRWIKELKRRIQKAKNKHAI